MSVSVWANRGSKTGKELALALGVPLNSPADLVIRWGSTVPEYGRPFDDINSRDAIVLSSDKARARQVLRENDIPVPDESETEFPIVARTRRHRSGSGLWLCNNERELTVAKLEGAHYFSKLFPKTRELRVHVGITDGVARALLVSEKEGGDRSNVVWNHSRSNFQLRHLHRSVWLADPLVRKAIRRARKAVEVLGLDFGAVDVMLTDDSYAITEVNTAPSLSPLALDKYVNYFLGVL